MAINYYTQKQVHLLFRFKTINGKHLTESTSGNNLLSQTKRRGNPLLFPPPQTQHTSLDRYISLCQIYRSKYNMMSVINLIDIDYMKPVLQITYLGEKKTYTIWHIYRIVGLHCVGDIAQN